MLMLAGGGILAHPDGIAAGVASIREGWQAAIDGIALEEYAASHPALRQALGKFAKR
jgi:ribulose-bisphosphate carboxylase large chain